MNKKIELITKPEAIARIMEGLEKKGLYKPEDLTYIPEIDGEKTAQRLTLDQYGKLQEQTVKAGIQGNIKRAEQIRGIMNRHAPALVINLKAGNRKPITAK